jgi:hypothetical protein
MILKTARTPSSSPSWSNHRRTCDLPLVSALDAAGRPACTALQQLPPGQPQGVKIGLRNNRRKRAPSGILLYWLGSPSADGTARVMRDLPREKDLRDRHSRREFSTRFQHWECCKETFPVSVPVLTESSPPKSNNPIRQGFPSTVASFGANWHRDCATNTNGNSPIS